MMKKKLISTKWKSFCMLGLVQHHLKCAFRSQFNANEPEKSKLDAKKNIGLIKGLGGHDVDEKPSISIDMEFMKTFVNGLITA